MKILHITSTPVFYPGGMEKVIWEISKKLSKNHEVTILQTNLYDEKKNYEKVVSREGVKVITCKNNFFFFGYGYSLEFKKILKSIWKDYDLVHVHGCGRFTTDYSLNFLKRKLPLVFTSHGFFHTRDEGFLKFFNKLLLKRNFKNVDYFTALTSKEFGEYGSYGVPQEKIFEVPNGIELKNFKMNSEKVLNFKKKYGLKGRTILFVGRIHESKGLDSLVKSIKDIDCKLLIVGRDSGYRKDLEILSKKLGVSEKIIFMGSVSEEDLITAYFSSEVFSLPSRHEGFGIVIIEAMAAGLPLVVSDRGSLPELVKAGKNGFLFKFGDVISLSKHLNNVLNNKNLRKRISKENLRKSQKYDWSRIVKMYEDIYRKSR